jgi:hypothetical protein
MSTLKVNTITNVAGQINVGKVVTHSFYTDATSISGGAAPVTLFNMSFTKKYDAATSSVYGFWSISNLCEGAQAQRYRAIRSGSTIGEMRMRHAESGWNMEQASFNWQDTTAPAGSLTYTLQMAEYVGQFYYNYPTNLSGSPNAISHFTIMEILN